MTHRAPDPRSIVYLIDASIAVTGAFIAARNMARALADSVRFVLVLPQNSTIPAAELGDFWRVDYLPIGALSKKIRALLCYFPALIYSAWMLNQRMRADGATRVQINDFFLLHGAMLRVLGFRGEIITWVRCHPRRFAGFLANPMLYFVQRSSDRVVAVSMYIQSLLPKTYPTTLIYDGYFGNTRIPRNWRASDEKTLVMIGNYIPGKGQDMALAAFMRAAAEDATLRLAFYGGDMGLPKNRHYRTLLEATAAQSQYAARIHFGDFLPDSFPILETAFAALNFSDSESFSMTVLEASGAGVPVIATASGGPQEIIADGITGYLVPVGDIAAASARMLALASNPIAAEAMGQAGAKHVREKFPQTIPMLWGQ